MCWWVPFHRQPAFTSELRLYHRRYRRFFSGWTDKSVAQWEINRCDQRHIPDAEGRVGNVDNGIFIHAVVTRYVETVCLLCKQWIALRRELTYSYKLLCGAYGAAQFIYITCCITKRICTVLYRITIIMFWKNEWGEIPDVKDRTV